jgi:hypothetical protein
MYSNWSLSFLCTLDKPMLLLQHFNATLMELTPQNNAKLRFLTILLAIIYVFFIPRCKIVSVYFFCSSPLTLNSIQTRF